MIIQGVNYELKWTIRGRFVFEQIAGRPFDPSKIMDEYVLLYSLLLANNPDTFVLPFEEFIDECDKDKKIFVEFRKWFLDVVKQEAMLISESENAEKKKTTKK